MDPPPRPHHLGSGCSAPSCSGLQSEDQLLLRAWVPGLGPGCPGLCPPALFVAPRGHSSSLRTHKGLAQGRAGKEENGLPREREMVGKGYL